MASAREDEPPQRSIRLEALNPRHPTLESTLVGSQRFRLGRKADCDIAFEGDFRISSVHASFLLDETHAGRWPPVLVQDTSVNGTWVNGVRVPRNSRRALQDEDQVFLVIPNRDAQAGSLTTSYVGYVFRYADTDEASRRRERRPPDLPPRALGALPSPSPNREPATGAAGRAGGSGCGGAAGGEAPEWLRGEAVAPAGGARGRSADGHVAPPPSRPQQAEHVSFAQWWLAELQAPEVGSLGSSHGSSTPLALTSRRGDNFSP